MSRCRPSRLGHLYCDPSNKFNILILGYHGSGKTEIRHKLAVKKRRNYRPTNHACISILKLGNYQAILTEISGLQYICDAWRVQYAQAHAIIYVVDIADESRMTRSYNILTEIISDRYLSGKPILVMGNKTDKCDDSAVWAFYRRFSLEWLARMYDTQLVLQSCGRYDNIELNSGFDWLIYAIKNDDKGMNNLIKIDKDHVKMQQNRENEIRRVLNANQMPKFIERRGSTPPEQTTANDLTRVHGFIHVSSRALRNNRIRSE